MNKKSNRSNITVILALLCFMTAFSHCFSEPVHPSPSLSVTVTLDLQGVQSTQKQAVASPESVTATTVGVCGAGQSESSGYVASGEGSVMDLGTVVETPPVTYGDLTCDRFESGGACMPVLEGVPCLITNHSRSNQSVASQHIQYLLGALLQLNPSQQCLDRAAPLLCLYAIPPCDLAFDIPVYQPICQWDCTIIRDFACPAEWQAMVAFQNSLVNISVIDPFDCSLLKVPNAGDAPLCVSTLDGGDIPQPVITGDSCYSGKGRGYTGTVSKTETGLTCASWVSFYPHQHSLSPYVYPELLTSYGYPHNFCRNPGEKGKKPWCFTTDRNVRWEYCDIPKCEAGPTCQRYTGSLCRTVGSIGMDYVYVDTSVASMEQYESEIMQFNGILGDSFADCQANMTELVCHTTFPLCDLSHPTPRPRPVCQAFCTSVVDSQACAEFITGRTAFQHILPKHVTLPNCSIDSVLANGGDNPECYQPIIMTGLIESGTPDCYNVSTKGVDYNGTVNVTQDGTPCQAWDDVSPHIHPFNSLFRRFLEGHNYCRNPEGRGEKPWCYTSDSDLRWDYCDIPACPEDTFWTTEMIIIVAAAGALLLLLIVAVVCCVTCCCVVRKRKKRFQLQKEQLYYSERYVMKGLPAARNPFTVKNPTGGIVMDAIDLDIEQLRSYSRDKLTYVCDLGQGHFGVVIRAEATEIIPGEKFSTVAVKVLKEGATDSAKKEFFKEAALMNTFDNPNILRLLGVCIEEEPLCMIFEYMDWGDMNQFLRECSPNQSAVSPKMPGGLSMKQLVEMSVHIAAGLKYLHHNRYVHRDLATRNCLVDSNLFVKIADFGLSQDVYTTDYFRLGDSELLPIRWMPPESIVYSTFSAQSDVWSFGVVLWEIFSFGMQPYFGMSNEEVVKYVREGHVLGRPEHCPSELYDLMVDCWILEPKQRPVASEIHVGLQRWTPEMSAQLQVQEKHTNYQNMSTILEWARRSLDGTATQIVLAESSLTNGVNGDASNHKPYDHLQPKENGLAVTNGCTDAIVTTHIDAKKNGATSTMPYESKYQNSITITQFVAEETV